MRELFIPILFLALAKSSALPLIENFLVHIVKFSVFSLLLWCGIIASIVTFYLKIFPRKIYLVDFACYKPNDPGCYISKELFMELQAGSGYFREESSIFLKKILDRSGFGQKTYMPKSLMKLPLGICIDEARDEAESVVFGVIDELLLKTKVDVKDIGIIITNCSIFNPTPSLSDMVVNHYKFKQDVVSYNLSGMGCSAGLLAIDLAKQLLQVR